MLAAVEKIFDAFRSEFTTRRSQAISDFDALVEQIANGETPAIESVQSILDAAGKTLDDLKASADLKLKRRAWNNDMAQARDCESPRREIEAKITKVSQKANEAQSKFDDELFLLNVKLREIRDVEGRGNAARASLQMTAPQEKKDRLKSLRAEIDQLTAECKESSVKIGRLQGHIAKHKQSIAKRCGFVPGHPEFERQKPILLRAIELCESEGSGLELKIKELEQTIAKLQQQAEGVERSMLRE